MRKPIAGVVFPLFMILFAASPNSSAQPVTKVCTSASITGAYGFTISGLIAPNGNLAAFSDSGTLTSDGNGNLTGSDSVSISGQVTPRTVTGTYSVSTDCTGSAILTDNLGNLTHLNLVIGVSGIQLIQTDTGAIISGEAKRRRSACSAQDLNGAYTFATSGWFGANATQGFADAGRLVGDGAGNFSLNYTISAGGVIAARVIAGTYSINGDCTGVAEFTDPGLGVIRTNFTVVASGREIQFFETDTGTSVTGTAKRQFALSGILSQVASGGPWKTTITLISQKPSLNEVKVDFWANDGTPLNIPFTVTQQGVSVPGSGTSVDRGIPPGGTLVIETEAPASPIVVGWAQVSSSGPVEGSAIFRSRSQAGTDSEGTAPLDISGAAALVLPYDNTAGFVTGAAFVNPSASGAATLFVTIRDDAGTQLATGTLTLPSNGHASFSLPTQFPSTSGRRGTIEFQVTSGGVVAGLGLRFNVFGSFTSVPLIVKE